MFIIAYPPDADFLNSHLVWFAQRHAKYRQLHDLLEAVCADPRVQWAVRRDLAPPKTQASWNGAPALPAVVTICLAVIRRLMGWGYRTVADEVSTNAGWRWVCQLYNAPMPNFRTIQEREAKLRPKTLQLINQVVVEVAGRLGITQGRQLRVDSSVTETNIHFPTDSSLLDDAARVLSRTIRQVRGLCPPRSALEKQWYRDRHRAAHHLACQIAQWARQHKNTEKSSVRLYQQLLGLVETLVEQVRPLQPRLAALPGLAALGLGEVFEHYLPLVQRIVHQTRQRVLAHRVVAAAHKVVSLFEPHTAIIRRGKAKPHETEFGRRIWLSEVEGGLITEWHVLRGNPSDTAHWLPSLKHHRQVFGRMPREASGDRGVYSAENEREAHKLGVKRVCLPKPGHKTTRRRRHERQSWFRAARRFRNGIEGRISQLRRARGLHRCLNHGETGMERWVGWGIIANNLAVIGFYLNKHRLSLAKALSRK